MNTFRIVKSYAGWILAGLALVGLELAGVVLPRPAHPKLGAPVGIAGCAYLRQYGDLHGYPPITACNPVSVSRTGDTASGIFRIQSQGQTFDLQVTFVRSPWQVTAAATRK
jgi:hypothetical protein